MWFWQRPSVLKEWALVVHEARVVISPKGPAATLEQHGSCPKSKRLCDTEDLT
jgi:hypothetical protein